MVVWIWVERVDEISGCLDLGLKGDELRSAVIGANQGEGTSEPSPFALRVLPQLTMSRARVDLQGFNNGCRGFLIWWETFEFLNFLDLIILFGFENIGGFGLFFLWVSEPIFNNDSFSLSQNSTNLDFSCLFPEKIYEFDS